MTIVKMWEVKEGEGNYNEKDKVFFFGPRVAHEAVQTAGQSEKQKVAGGVSGRGAKRLIRRKKIRSNFGREAKVLSPLLGERYLVFFPSLQLERGLLYREGLMNNKKNIIVLQRSETSDGLVDRSSFPLKCCGSEVGSNKG